MSSGSPSTSGQADTTALPYFAARVAEMNQWQQAHPEQESGRDPLPDGWRVVATARIRSPLPQYGTFTHLRLARVASGGGWVLVVGTGMVSRDQVVDAAETFSDLYAMAHELASEPSHHPHTFSSGFWWEAAERLMRGFLLDLYDASDADEAAEQVVVALGGEPVLIPAALR